MAVSGIGKAKLRMEPGSVLENAVPVGRHEHGETVKAHRAYVLARPAYGGSGLGLGCAWTAYVLYFPHLPATPLRRPPGCHSSLQHSLVASYPPLPRLHSPSVAAALAALLHFLPHPSLLPLPTRRDPCLSTAYQPTPLRNSASWSRALFGDQIRRLHGRICQPTISSAPGSAAAAASVLRRQPQLLSGPSLQRGVQRVDQHHRRPPCCSSSCSSTSTCSTFSPCCSSARHQGDCVPRRRSLPSARS
ncbi:hypothetical protein SETIT_8G179100v2 [Setaria italica]|uniref:Uncharacterized protein n=1 Tax=Setaria italica TaxID=4555 RepID=A0A368S916_SETIT|nr:hypothetical protein SETIT_8G179100v2 [Setaria italica]